MKRQLRNENSGNFFVFTGPKDLIFSWEILFSPYLECWKVKMIETEVKELPKFIQVVTPWDIGETTVHVNFFGEYYADGKIQHIFRTNDETEFFKALYDAGYRRTEHGDYALMGS
jgi:hypothetical protein